ALSRNFGAGGADLSSSPPTGVGDATPHRVYLGYAAQPFINEVAVHQEVKEIPTGSGTFKTIVSESAIELYNPYDVALSLDGFRIHVAQAPSLDIDLSGRFIPARGYLIIRGATHK